MSVFFFQAEDGIRDLVRSRGLGDVYKRQVLRKYCHARGGQQSSCQTRWPQKDDDSQARSLCSCLLYTSDAADERSSVDLGGRRIIKKKKQTNYHRSPTTHYKIDRSTTRQWCSIHR